MRNEAIPGYIQFSDNNWGWIGSATSIWRSELEHYSDLEIQENTKDLVNNFVRTLKS